MCRLGNYLVGLEPCVAPFGTLFVGVGRCSSMWPCCGRQNTEMKAVAGEGLRRAQRSWREHQESWCVLSVLLHPWTGACVTELALECVWGS